LRKEIEQLANQEELKKKERNEMKRNRESSNQQSLSKQQQGSDFNSKLDQLRHKRYHDEIERRERQRELDLETQKIKQKILLIDEVEKQKDINTIKAINNYDEERKIYENGLFLKKQAEQRESREKENRLRHQLENKD